MYMLYVRVYVCVHRSYACVYMLCIRCRLYVLLTLYIRVYVIYTRVNMCTYVVLYTYIIRIYVIYTCVYVYTGRIPVTSSIICVFDVYVYVMYM